MNLIKVIGLFLVLSIAGFLVGCVPLLSKYTYISLEGDWSDKVVKKGKVKIGGDTNFFTDEINIEYRYELENFVVYAKIPAASLPSVEFRLENSYREAQELKVSSNHPCYFNRGLNYRKGEDGKFLLPMERDRLLAVYQFIEINPYSEWTKLNLPKCYKKELQEPLFIMLKSPSNDFELSVPIKINQNGYYLHFDGL